MLRHASELQLGSNVLNPRRHTWLELLGGAAAVLCTLPPPVAAAGGDSFVATATMHLQSSENKIIIMIQKAACTQRVNRTLESVGSGVGV